MGCKFMNGGRDAACNFFQLLDVRLARCAARRRDQEPTFAGDPTALEGALEGLSAWQAARQKHELATEKLAAGEDHDEWIAKMEAADGSVTIDLLVFALAGLGATRKELARILNARTA